MTSTLDLEVKQQMITTALNQIGISVEDIESIEKYIDLYDVSEQICRLKILDLMAEQSIQHVKLLADTYGGNGDTQVFEDIRTEIKEKVKELKTLSAESFELMKNRKTPSVH